LKIITNLIAATFIAAIPFAVSAEIVGIGGKAEGYFPQDDLQTQVLDENVMIGAYADQKAWTFYSLFLYQNHGQEVSERWFSGFVKGQETSAGVVDHAQTRVLHSSTDNGRVTGSFVLFGKLEGSPYEKLCAFQMGPVDYATWCVAVIADRGSAEQARDEFFTHAPKFRLF